MFHMEQQQSPCSQDVLLLGSLPDASPPETDPAAAAFEAAAAAAATAGPRDRSRLAAAAGASYSADEDINDVDADDDAVLIDSPLAKRQLFSGGHADVATPAAAAAAAARQSGNTPIAALPPMSQLDPEVFAALPADVRRELVAAYNRGKLQQQQKLVKVSAARGLSRSPGDAAGKGKKQQQQQLQQQQKGRDGGGGAAAAAGNWLKGAAAAAGTKRQGRKQQQQHLAFVGGKRQKHG
jgi:hypothetical protein